MNSYTRGFHNGSCFMAAKTVNPCKSRFISERIRGLVDATKRYIYSSLVTIKVAKNIMKYRKLNSLTNN